MISRSQDSRFINFFATDELMIFWLLQFLDCLTQFLDLAIPLFDLIFEFQGTHR